MYPPRTVGNDFVETPLRDSKRTKKQLLLIILNTSYVNEPGIYHHGSNSLINFLSLALPDGAFALGASSESLLTRDRWLFLRKNDELDPLFFSCRDKGRRGGGEWEGEGWGEGGVLDILHSRSRMTSYRPRGGGGGGECILVNKHVLVSYTI